MQQAAGFLNTISLQYFLSSRRTHKTEQNQRRLSGAKSIFFWSSQAKTKFFRGHPSGARSLLLVKLFFVRKGWQEIFIKLAFYFSNMFNKFKSAGKLTKITLIVILAGILLRFIIASYTIEGGDPCYHASAARFVGRNFHYPLYEYLGREIFAHEPLFHFFGGLFYFVFEKFGMGDFGIHMVAPLFGSLIIIFTYFICKKLLDKRKTLYAMIFVSFIPLEIYHSTTTHIDIVSAFFA